MPRILLEQGSPEWLKYRSSRIMATDASTILGENKWKTPLELWQEKLGYANPEIMNEKMKEGQKLEPEARDLAIKELMINFEPCVYESTSFCWRAASLDGMNNEGDCLLEIKCGKNSYKQALAGIVPIYYYIQMQHQLLTTRAERCFYFCYRPKLNPIIREIIPDEEMFSKIQISQEEFWHNLWTLQSPINWKLNYIND